MRASMRFLSLLFVMASVLLAACGGSGNNLTQKAAETGALSHSSSGLTLHVSPDSLAPGGSMEAVELDVREESDGSLKADVVVIGAEDLKALYFSIEYDTKAWHALESSSRPEFAAEDELLELSVLDTDQAMHHGQLLIHPQSAEGYSGRGALTTVRFVPGELQQARAASKAPTGPGTRSDISYELNTTYGLFWHYYNQGDYDQNGEVNISDLTPLGINLKEIGPFGPATPLGIVDGDANGEINLADITPIGANFGATVSSYNLYASDNFEDYPADNGPSVIEPYASKDFLDYQLPDAVHHRGPLPKDGRLFYWGDIISQPQGQQDYAYYWVRPTDGTDEGMPSYVLASPRWASNPALPQPPTVTVDDAQGSGGPYDPFLAEPGGEYKITVMHPELGDISTDPTIWYRLVSDNGTPWPHASISNQDAILRIDSDAPVEPGALHLQYFFGVLNYSQGVLGGLRGQGGPWGRVFRRGPALTDPSAVIDITPLEAPAPLEFSFDASGSFSPNGEITTYSWNFDKNGPSGNNSSEVSGEHSYAAPGVYVVELLIIDEWNQRSTTQVVVTAMSAPGEAPVASIIDDQEGFFAPLTVNFTAEYSQASEGRSIVKYEWDIDNNEMNGFELDTGTVPFAQFTYEEGLFGYNPRVRVTDDQGDSGIAQTILTLYSPLNDPPKIELQIDVTEGSSPLMVNFDASGTTDEDGEIAKWGWDFNGDGDLELFDGSDPPAGPVASYTYATSGAFHGYLYVWDDDDELNFREFVIRTDGAPTAVIEDLGGPFLDNPLTLELDASGSTDPDGSIVEYRWDFDGDDVVDEVTTVPTVMHEFTAGGSQLVKVTVMDDNGLTDWTYTSFTIF